MEVWPYGWFQKKNILQTDFKGKHFSQENTWGKNSHTEKKNLSWCIILKKKILHLCMSGKKFYHQRFWKQIITQSKSLIAPFPPTLNSQMVTKQSQKLSFYWTIKDDYSPSPYLVLTRKNPSRKALVRFRISSHQLRIETGRYENIPRNERICHFCTSNKIEDENHFLLDCKAYSQIRDIFFSKLETKIPDFKSLSHDTLISLLMNSSDYLINCQLVSFISQCFELRTKLISMNEWMRTITFCNVSHVLISWIRT